jgi:hypothetical protein
MYQKLQTVSLKSGEEAEMGIVSGPDTTTWGEQTRLLLGHKPGIFKWQIDEFLTKPQLAESRFYILSKKSKPFANIMLIEGRGIGIFGHVYTVPEERRKGAADIIHHHLMEDFKKRGGRAMYLGTGYDSPPYHLYAKHGFAGVEPKSGAMFWFAKGQQAFEAEVFAKSAVTIEPLVLKHYPTLPALAMMKHPARVRISGMGVVGIVSTEGGSLEYLSNMTQPKPDPLGSCAYVAVSEKSGIPVAIAASAPHPVFHKQSDGVDLFCAPGFEAELPKLYQKLNLNPARGLYSYADPLWPEKAEALKACGLQKAGVLKNFVALVDGATDLEVWSR